MSWTTKNNLNTARDHPQTCGIVSASLLFGGASGATWYTNCEYWNGSSWATTPALSQAIAYGSSVGSVSSALCIGGFTAYNTEPVASVQKWSGSAWATTTIMNTVRRNHASCGTSSSALTVGGYTTKGSGTVVDTVEKYNGSSWATTTSASFEFGLGGGCGTTSDALFVSGTLIPIYDERTDVPTLKWNGSAWSSGCTPLYQVSNFGLTGTASSTILYGGTIQASIIFAGHSSKTEFWNGSSWATVSSMNTDRYSFGSGAGEGNSSALAAGGRNYAGGPLNTTEQYDAELILYAGKVYDIDFTNPPVTHVFGISYANINKFMGLPTVDTVADSTEVGTYACPSQDRGIFGGGTLNGNLDQWHNDIDYITISVGDFYSIDFGDLTVSRGWISSTSNSSDDRGLFAGGRNASSYFDTIDYVTISSVGDATDFGNLIGTKRGLTATSNGTDDRGIFCGGHDGGEFWGENYIDYVTISSTGNASDFGDLTRGCYFASTTSNGTSDRAVTGGGASGENTIDYVTITSTGNASDFGDLINPYDIRTAALSNLTNNRGVWGGGGSSGSNVIQYLTITSTGNASDFGDLNYAKRAMAATSNGTANKGLFCGGIHADANIKWAIEEINISSLGNATKYGMLNTHYPGDGYYRCQSDFEGCSNSA